MSGVSLLTTSRLLSLCPDPPATVSVRNLRTTLSHSAHDAWNRPHKAQPWTISATVAFHAPFASASANDRLGADTVHYGMLSKAVLGSAKEADGFVGTMVEEGKGARVAGWGMWHVLGWVWQDLTGVEFDGSGAGGDKEPLLNVRRVRFLSVTVGLPKASLLGDGVSLTASAVFDERGGSYGGRAMKLEVERLRVPTLIGVNDNERLRKQFVLATVTVEGFDREDDVYTEIEDVVVKAMEESSFETLEALGARLAETALAVPQHQDSWQVCIRMEKPTAVPLADCPIVEVRMKADSVNK